MTSPFDEKPDAASEELSDESLEQVAGGQPLVRHQPRFIWPQPIDPPIVMPIEGPVVFPITRPAEEI